MQAKRSKNSGGFFGAGERGIPLFAKKQSNIQKLENIRENTTLRNLESSTDSESSSTEPKTDSKKSTESKEILNNTQRQNLRLKEFAESAQQTPRGIELKEILEL